MIFQNEILRKSILFTVFTLLLFSLPVGSQDLPKKIRGYKVVQTKISVKTHTGTSSEKTDAEALVKIGEPELTDISLTGITLEVPAEIEGVDQNGKIDFISFEDFKVNGLDVEVEDYKESFELKRGEKMILPKPVKLFISAGQTLRGAFREIRETKDEWTVSGRLFVFGKFKKYGFSFKRVVPLEINLTVENPVKKKLAQIDLSK